MTAGRQGSDVMRKTRLAIVAAAALAVLGATAIAAEKEEAKGVVAVRQNAMKAQGAHLKAIQEILTGAPELINQVPIHAQAIASIAKITPDMFPAGSDKGKTEALPKVWSDEAGFKEAAMKASGLADKLAETARGGDRKATLAAFATLGKQGCGGCHSTYRKKES